MSLETFSQASPMESAVGVTLRRQFRILVRGVRLGSVAPEDLGRWFCRLSDAEVEALAGEECLRAEPGKG